MNGWATRDKIGTVLIAGSLISLLLIFSWAMFEKNAISIILGMSILGIVILKRWKYRIIWFFALIIELFVLITAASSV